jgi:hypothetical protein
MKVARSAIVALLAASAFAQAPMLRAKMTSVSIEQCHRGQSARYELKLGGTLEFENTSNETLLLPKKIEVVRGVVAALTPDDARNKKYIFVMNQEFGGRVKSAKPKLEDFVALTPGASATVRLEGAVLPASADANDRGGMLFNPGTYWVQLYFAALPGSLVFSSENLARAKKKLGSFGTLVDTDVLTEPFRLDVAPDPKARKCEP